MNDGGPAFPKAALRADGLSSINEDGMTLLDYFAGQVVAGMSGNTVWDDADADDMGIISFGVAVAMIEERERRMKEADNE